ncbi:MAG TPA: cytidylate kinase-like family protein [Prolixibacteraceae bacterium]|nr:cytidylate kinase-like family protein [Prolixibacteraceae bacterium]
MENLLLKYMGERLEFSAAKRTHLGPVITISRESGCPGNLVAELLVNKLNDKMIADGLTPKWKWVNKEILQKASEELKMNPSEIETYVKASDSGLLHDIVSSFTESYYIKNAKIKKVIYHLIRNLAAEGHVIIVGRGGGAIAWDIPKSLHVYLEAPLSWKTNVVSTVRSVSMAEARKLVLERDSQRSKFRDNYRPKFSDEIYYHERFNCKALTGEQICELVFQAAELKKLV